MSTSGRVRGHRVVVVGSGMVGTRFVDELGRITRGTTGRVMVTVLGEEPHAPYNRVLLSDAVAGRASLTALELPRLPTEHLTVHAGRRATRIDRHTGGVEDDAGRVHPFDTLVLAIGAAARLPDLDGLPSPRVRPLRSVDDARALLAALPRAERVAVLGGGVLGVEVACGLRARGADVTLVHHRDRLMERDLDATGADVLAETLADLGIRVVRDARVVSLRRSRGELAALQFADDRELACDLLVPAMGTVPRAELRSLADARIAAIGDCAEPPEGCLGLVAPGWAQAARLAAQVAAQATGEPVPDAASGAPTTARVVRLKAVGAEAVSLGAARPPAGSRLLNLVDVAGRRSVTVSVADGRVVSAVCVGSPRTAAALTVSFERGTPVPSDPAWLLVDAGALALAPQANSPATMPGHATVCSCNGVTKGQIVEAHRSGARAVPDVAAVTRATTGCGGCRVTVEGLLDWLDRSDAAPPEPPEQPDQPVLPAVPARADRCETDVARV
jgi:assimilatory nitrate reductase electron transfer subunit